MVQNGLIFVVFLFLGLGEKGLRWVGGGGCVVSMICSR